MKLHKRLWRDALHWLVPDDAQAVQIPRLVFDPLNIVAILVEGIGVNVQATSLGVA
jgi:hypothetical protein